MTTPTAQARRGRLTSYARGSGCACKIPPGELEEVLAGLAGVGVLANPPGRVVAGLDEADDAAIVQIADGQALVLTTDFFGPVVDDAYDWGRIAATNALSDVYAVGGRPVLAVNLLGWPRSTLSMELAGEVLRGGLAVTQAADCFLAGGHSIDAVEPMYGLAVTGTVDPARTLRLDAGRPGTPLSLTKPLGIGVLNARHKHTGEVFPEAIAAMTTLNREAAAAAVASGATCATDVTGFGLLGHLLRVVRASGVGVVLDTAAIPYLDGARAAAEGGYVSGGARRNLDWVRPQTDLDGVGEVTALLLADPQTSGGLLIAGEVPGGVVIGEIVARSAGPLIRCR